MLDEKSDGSSVEISIVKDLVITLASNPSTGYSWQVSEMHPTMLQKIGETEFIPPEEEEITLGSGGREKLTFRAISKGTTTLKLVYKPLSSPSLAPPVNQPQLYNVNLELRSDERGTYRTGKQQLDYLFVSSLRQKLTSVYIKRRGAYAKSKWQRFDTVTSHSTAASDHSAVMATFNL